MNLLDKILHTSLIIGFIICVINLILDFDIEGIVKDDKVSDWFFEVGFFLAMVPSVYYSITYVIRILIKIWELSR